MFGIATDFPLLAAPNMLSSLMLLNGPHLIALSWQQPMFTKLMRPVVLVNNLVLFGLNLGVMFPARRHPTVVPGQCLRVQILTY